MSSTQSYPKQVGDVDILIHNDSNNPSRLIMDIKTKYFSIADEWLDIVDFNPQKLTDEQMVFLNLIDRIKLN